MSRTIGIDLGTTTSVVTYMKDGKPHVIVDLQDQNGGKIIPSIVGIKEDGTTIVGKAAKSQILAHPERTAVEVKRLFGSDKLVKMGDSEYQPYEISAILLANLKKMAEAYLHEEVKEAVITVPANFNNIQRELTKKAGEMAGLKVERIINEPTAAAISYGFENSNKEETVLVYDLGGGTFDVTILEIIDGVVDVICSRGNNTLGGKDFDHLLERYIINDFYNKYDINLVEQGDLRILTSIKEKIEEAKKDLSTQNSVNIYIPYVAFKDNQPLSIDIDVTKEEFENMIMDLVISTCRTIDDALNEAKLTTDDIDTVVLVGGSTRVPLVRNIVDSKLPNKIKNNINPDFAVAMGAAIQAEIKSSFERNTRNTYSEDNNMYIKTTSEPQIVITDKCSHNLGVSVRDEVDGLIRDGVFSIIIEKDCSIPCTKSKTYTTVYDNQKEVLLPIYEGDSKFVRDNTKIGQVRVSGIPKAKAGKEDIIVEFKYDLNGMVDVKATIASTNESIGTTIDFGQLIKESSVVIEKSGESIVITERKFNKYESNNNYSNNIKSINTDINKYNDDNYYKECKLYSTVKNSMEFAEMELQDINNSNIKIKINEILDNMKKSIIADDKNKLIELDKELTNIIFEI